MNPFKTKLQTIDFMIGVAGAALVFYPLVYLQGGPVLSQWPFWTTFVGVMLCRTRFFHA